MLRMMILGTITVLMIQALHGAPVEPGRLTAPAGHAAAGLDAGLDSTYLLPEMVITAPRFQGEGDYSPARYHYDRTGFQAAVRRLIRIAGFMVMVSMTAAWIVLTISRIPHINRARNTKKHYQSYLRLARNRHEPWTGDRKP